MISRRRSRCSLSLWGPLFASFVAVRCLSSFSTDNAVFSLFRIILSTAASAFNRPSRVCFSTSLLKDSVIVSTLFLIRDQVLDSNLGPADAVGGLCGAHSPKIIESRPICRQRWSC